MPSPCVAKPKAKTKSIDGGIVIVLVLEKTEAGRWIDNDGLQLLPSKRLTSVNVLLI